MFLGKIKDIQCPTNMLGRLLKKKKMKKKKNIMTQKSKIACWRNLVRRNEVGMSPVSIGIPREGPAMDCDYVLFVWQVVICEFGDVLSMDLTRAIHT